MHGKGACIFPTMVLTCGIYFKFKSPAFNTKATQWDTLGVHGIFMDEAGYEVSHSTQV